MAFQNNFRHFLQIDVDNQNQKPTYKLAVNAANYFSLVTVLIIYSAIYPYLSALAFLFTYLKYVVEKQQIAKVCFIRH